jgi:hypothetical protein
MKKHLGSDFRFTAVFLAGSLVLAGQAAFGDGISIRASDVDCGGYVTVEGNFDCNQSCSSPVNISVVNGSETTFYPSTHDVSCSYDEWVGQWGGQQLALQDGINVISALSDCDAFDTIWVVYDTANCAIWTYEYKNEINNDSLGQCGMFMTIDVECLEQTKQYKIYETYQWESGDTCHGAIQFTEFSDNILISTDGSGLLSWDDKLSHLCPGLGNYWSYSHLVPCHVIINKVWHVYDPVTLNDATSSPDTLDLDLKTTSPRLKVSDSKISHIAQFQ